MQKPTPPAPQQPRNLACSAPAVIIRLEFEARPRIIADYLTDADESRMLDWLDGRPEVLELLATAQEIIASERRAA